MRPVRLNIQRFLGIESVTLDFSSQLFVVVGPNGAGKSSILEALYYALFGKGIRTERGKKELLHRGYPAESLRVELEFDLAGSGYRVTREYSPKRGSAAVLERQSSQGWEPLCSGEQSVNAEIVRLSGLDGETFRSSVFLPQGETLAFVEATPARRFKILSTLFGLDVLDRVREKARGRLERLEGTLVPAQERRESLMRENVDETLGQRQAELNRLRKTSSDLEQEIFSGDQKVKDLASLWEIHLTVLKSREKVTSLSRQRRDAEEKAELDRKITAAVSIAAGTFPLWQAASAALRQVNSELEDRQKKILHLKKTGEEAVRQIEEGMGRERETGEQLERLTRYRDRLDQEGRPLAGELDRLSDRLSVLGKERSRLDDKEKTLTRQEIQENRDKERITVQVNTERETLILLHQTLVHLTEVVQQGEPLHKQLEMLEKELQRIRNEILGVEKERDTFNASETKLNRLLERHAEQRDALRLEQEIMESAHREAVRRFAIQELHGKWVETGVCPVCQTQTPPLQVLPGEMGPENMLDLDQRYRAFRERLTRLETEWATLASQEAGVRERGREAGARLGSLRDREQSLELKRGEIEQKIADLIHSLPGNASEPWPAVVERVSRERGALDEKRELIHHLDKELTVREEKLRGIRERYQDLLTRLDQFQREQDKLTRLWQEGERKLGDVLAEMNLSRDHYPQARVAFHDYWDRCRKAHEGKNQEHTRINAELVRLREHLSGIENRRGELDNEVQNLLKRFTQLETDEQQKEKSFLNDLEVHGFDLATFTCLKDRTVEGWQERLTKMSGEIESLNGAIREGEERLKAGTSRWDIDSGALGKEYDEIKVKLDRLRQEAGDTREKSGALIQEIDLFHQKKKELVTLEQNIKLVMEERETHRRLKEALEVRRFKNYLLGILLKELEHESSAFLWALSEGRYRIAVHMAGGEAEIMVLDERLGAQSRGPAECSGGEKTLIALSLSLALSRIRIRESGRGEAACLFIDEGFSPLDRDHLGLVADAIIRLGCDGKMVGVVTHDPQFAALFPVHLEVGGGNVEWKENQTLN